MQKSTAVATIALILLGGLWIATNVSKTLADGTELNSTNIVTTYECATDATSCILYNKGITSIAADTFINHTSLTTLSLGVNSISSIKSGDFAGTNLTYLDISVNNQIGSIESDDLIEIPNLQTLFLSSNEITQIESGFFSAHTGISTLYINNNFLTALPEDIMQLTNLTTLSLIVNCRNTGLMSSELINFLNEKSNNPNWQSSINTNCPVDLVSVYHSVSSVLEGQSIYNTLGSVTEENINNFTPLSFRTDYGSLSFLTGVDLKDENIQNFLQNLPNSFSMEDGYLSFTPTGNGIGLNLPARIDFWLGEQTPPFEGTMSGADALIIRNTSGNILTGIDLNGLFASDVECGMGEGYYCTFDVNHFTSFQLYYPPFDCNDVTDVSVTECEALVDMYDALNGDAWYATGGWKQATEVCTWRGITCTDINDDELIEELHVTSLDLRENHLVGTIPASISGLSYLNYLNVNYNYTGITELPDTLGSLTGLSQLEIGINTIAQLPASLVNLENLTYLYAEGNRLTSLPDGFENLEVLRELNISENCIDSNARSDELWNFLNNLEYLNYESQGREGHCPSDNVINPQEDPTDDYQGEAYIFGGLGVTGLVFGEEIEGYYSIESIEGDCPGEMCLDRLRFETYGLSLIVTSGIWDGFLYAPMNASGEAEFADEGIPDETEMSGSTTTTRAILMTKKAGSFDAGLQAIGGRFTLFFVVPSGTPGETLAIYRSEDADTREENEPDATCELDEDKVCEFDTDHLSYFTTLRETTTTDDDDTPPSGGNGGGNTITKDNCPNGDTSTSFYDGKCDNPHLAADNENVLSGVDVNYSEEIYEAYQRAFDLGITNIFPITATNPEGTLIRSHMAKIIVNYITKVLNKRTLDHGSACDFGDISDQSEDTQEYIRLACQLGIMGIDMENFEPDAIVTRAQFGTILSRVLYGDKNNGGTPYYLNHLNALKTNAIMTKIDNAEMTKEVMMWVWLMLMRADK